MSVFVLDSNILSFYLRQNQRVVQKVQDTLLSGSEILISPIAYYEVKRGLLAIKAEKRLKEFSALCAILGVGQLDNSILDFAAEIYRELREIRQIVEDADILTAAFCRKYAFILVTNNVRHFQVIPNLQYCDWV